MSITPTEMAALIDHTCLKPDVGIHRIRDCCLEAAHYGFCAVCIPPCYVSPAREIMKKQGPKICTVVGFPLGYQTTETKIYEARKAVEDGADEVDMVMNIAAFKDGRLAQVQEEINAVAEAIPSALLKVIVETAALDRREKALAAELVLTTGAHFIKTSTGFASSGATVEDVALIKSIVGDRKQIKAAGGIRDFDFAAALLDAGASRLGCSSSVELLGLKT